MFRGQVLGLYLEGIFGGILGGLLRAMARRNSGAILGGMSKSYKGPFLYKIGALSPRIRQNSKKKVRVLFLSYCQPSSAVSNTASTECHPPAATSLEVPYQNSNCFIINLVKSKYRKFS